MPGFSHFRFSLPTARNLVSFGANKPVLLLSNVTNLIDDFDGCLGKKTTASTTTLSSPQPQAGATSGRLTKALLSTLVAGPQETTCSCSTLPAGLATPGSSHPSSLLFKQQSHQTTGGFGASIPSFNLAGMFGCVDFEILFNVLVILGVIYLLFTPPVSGSPLSSFLHGLTTPTRLKTIPPRTNHSTLWTLPFLVALSWTVRRPTPAALAIPQRVQRSQAGLERPGPAAVPSSP